MLTKALAEQATRVHARAEQISHGGPVIVTIGTPVDEFLNPVRRVVQDCIDALAAASRRRPTCWCCARPCFPAPPTGSHAYLNARGRKLKIAFCPERVVQGYGIKELREMPQIISGTTPEAEREAAALFQSIAPEVVTVSPMEAEFAKLFNNAYRYIEFAATNEFYLIANSAGLDYQRILNAMKHNYPRARNIPGPGFAAGPCLVKDTMQLAAYARNQFGLGHAAMLINEGLVLHVVDDLKRRFDLEPDDRRPARHGIQGRGRRYARVAELQIQEQPDEPCARGADHRSLCHHRPGSVAAGRCRVDAATC